MQPMQEFNQLRDAHGRWTSVNSAKGKLMRVLKKTKNKVALKHPEGGFYQDTLKPQDHGIKDAVKAALIKRHFIADTSAPLQRLLIDILHTTTDEKVRKLIITAMKKNKW